MLIIFRPRTRERENGGTDGTQETRDIKSSDADLGLYARTAAQLATLVGPRVAREVLWTHVGVLLCISGRMMLE